MAIVENFTNCLYFKCDHINVNVSTLTSKRGTLAGIFVVLNSLFYMYLYTYVTYNFVASKI